MYAEIGWVLVFSGTQVQPQIILEPDYLPDYLSVSYDYAQCTVMYSNYKTGSYLFIILSLKKQPNRAV